MRAAFEQAIESQACGQFESWRMLQIMERNVGGDDQRPAAAVTAVNHVVDLFQTVLRPVINQLEKEKQAINQK